MRRLGWALLGGWSIVAFTVAPAWAQGPLPPPSAIPGTFASCTSPTPQTLKCEARWPIALAQPSATWSLGITATDGVGNLGQAVVPFAPDMAGPTVTITNVRQARTTDGFDIIADVEITDPAGVDAATLTGVATRQ